MVAILEQGVCIPADFPFLRSFFNVLIFGCTKLCLVAVSRATLHCGAWASHGSGPSSCRAQVLGTQAQ